jgi:hypothetical protein
MVYRIGAVGIDGAWKTASIDKAVQKLAEEYGICRVGRMFHYQGIDGEADSYNLINQFVEWMIARADHTPPRRLWVGLTQALFVLMQRFVEPYMERRYSPDLIINSRCMVVDPAVYLRYYCPPLGKLPVDKRLKMAQTISGAKLRDLYFLFEISTDVALQNITRYNERIQRSHPHETRKTIEMLQQEFEDVMRWAAMYPDVKIVRVNSSDKSIDELSDIIVRETKQFITDNPFPNVSRDEYLH